MVPNAKATSDRGGAGLEAVLGGHSMFGACCPDKSKGDLHGQCGRQAGLDLVGPMLIGMSDTTKLIAVCVRACPHAQTTHCFWMDLNSQHMGGVEALEGVSILLG